MVVLLAGSHAHADARIGWHAETMPDGLMRSAVRGEYVWQKDDSIMVYVPAGEFLMGSEDGDPDEQPTREIYLDAYYIDKYEVAWRQWKRSGLPYSEVPNSRRDYPEAPDWGIVDDHPVTNVSWIYAARFAHWAGKNLPTEAQWEKAARGTDGNVYPWGNASPSAATAVWRDKANAARSTSAVSCCDAGASPYGALNMAGNVYEWCADTYSAGAYTQMPTHNPLHNEPSPYRVLRGGAFLLQARDLRAALRYRLYPEDRADYIGMRAVVNANPASPSGSNE